MTTPSSDETKLIEEYLWITEKVAKRLWDTVDRQKQWAVISADIEDIQQSAAIGLIHAARTFDPSKGVSFKTYAWRCAFTEALKGLRSASDHNMRISYFPDELGRDLPYSPIAEEQAIFVQSVADILDGETDRDRWIFIQHFFGGVTLTQIGEDLGMSKQNVDRILKRMEVKLGA